MRFKAGDKVIIKKELWDDFEYYGILIKHALEMPLICTISCTYDSDCILEECNNGYVWEYDSLIPLSKSHFSPSLLLFLK